MIVLSPHPSGQSSPGKVSLTSELLLQGHAVCCSLVEDFMILLLFGRINPLGLWLNASKSLARHECATSGRRSFLVRYFERKKLSL